MNISLTPRLAAMIRDKVETGLYGNCSEVVRETLRLMEERDKEEALRAAIAQAKASVARGDVRPWTPQLMEEIWREATEAFEAEERPDPNVYP